MSQQPHQQRPQQPVQQRMDDRQEDRQPERLVRPGNVATMDKFAIDKRRLPKGYVAEWKRVSLFGLQDRENQVMNHQFHWKPVPHEQQPHVLGHTGKTGEPIVKGGLMLMMRPEYLKEEAIEERHHQTQYQVSQQLKSLRGSSKEQVGDRFTKFKREFVSQPVE